MSPEMSSVSYIIEPKVLEQLINLLIQLGYQVIGPTKRDATITYAPIDSIEQLPVGLVHEDASGFYLLEKSDENIFFGYTAPSNTLKSFLHPAEKTLFNCKQTKSGFKIDKSELEQKPFAFLGVRSCDVEAIRRLDDVLCSPPYIDSIYEQNRKNCLIIAVDCTTPGANCFCASYNTGPDVKSGYDLALTEMHSGTGHKFLIRAGSKIGTELLTQIQIKDASAQDISLATEKIQWAKENMGKKLLTDGLHEALWKNVEVPYWDEIARRCLSCGNCTMVCPTCFCHTIEDTTSLSGDTATRTRKWDSCFNVEFSYIFGGSVRVSTMSRFRQRVMHKLCTWQDQFHTSGCTGCGRCTTWCPVGIDFVNEANKIAFPNTIDRTNK